MRLLLDLSSFCHRVNHEDKNDVYDIGVILLELILGRPVMFHNEVGSLKDLVSAIYTRHEHPFSSQNVEFA